MAPGTARPVLSTPTKAPATPNTESPGTWRHPRLHEITKRQEAANFNEKNVRHIIINLALLAVLLVLHSSVKKALPNKRAAPHLWTYYGYVRYLLLALPVYNIAMSSWPLIRPKDDLSDIALTPAQRQLLGLPPSSTPPTPGSVYSTPPRYQRTPSGSGSGRRSFSSSPILVRSPSIQASPTPTGIGSGLISPTPNHLLQKAMLGARHTPRRSMGSPTPMGGSINGGSSIFSSSGGPDTPSPNPAGKLSTIGLNSKWRYDKGMYGKPKGFRDLNTDSMYS